MRNYMQEQGLLTDEDIVIPGKRKPDPNAEWRLQAKCAKMCLQRERTDPTFRFFSPGSEGARSPGRAAIAKMMGQNRKGVPDLWMFRCNMIELRVCVVEFKRPGGKLSPEQRAWFDWLPCPCHRIDNVEDFARVLAEF